MDIKKLQAIVVDALEDIKAQDIVLFDTTKLTSLFDRMVIASGNSNRQTKALAASVRDKVKEAGGTVIGMEGEDTGEWVLVDLGDIIVHIMQPAIRAYYQLEEIWGGKPIALVTAKRAVKSTAAEAKKSEKKPAARKSATKTAEPTTKKVATKKTAATGTKTTEAKKKTGTGTKMEAAGKTKPTKLKATSRKTTAKQTKEE